MRKLKNQKARFQTRHAKGRAFERYGLSINDQDLQEISSSIQSGKATHIFRQSNRVSIFKLVFKEKDIQVVYDSKRKTIVTFIPLDGPGDIYATEDSLC